MEIHGSRCYTRNTRRACIKATILAVLALAAVALLAWAVDDHALDHLKFDLSLTTLVLLVLAINLASFASLAVLYAAYRWVRCDLKPPCVEDVAAEDK